MIRFTPCISVLLLLVGLVSVGAALQPGQALPDHTAPSKVHIAAPTGEQVFKTQCSRCHMPPMSISPRITGTVIMHMRTRARLSRQDEQTLLKFMAP